MTQPNLIYAGIGSRETPRPVLQQMTSIAQQLSEKWQLRSGRAIGADTAFENGAKHKEIHVPWPGYNHSFINDPMFITPDPTPEMVDIAARNHPVWHKLNDTVKLLMLRNVSIVLGKTLDEHARMVICWTPNGRLVGGTAHGIRVAKEFHIPVFNIALPADVAALCKFVLEI